MANQISDSRQRVYLTLGNDLVAQIDGRAAAEGKTRTAVITEALEAYVSGDAQGDVALAKLETVIAKLDSIKSGQDAHKLCPECGEMTVNARQMRELYGYLLAKRQGERPALRGYLSDTPDFIR